MPLKTGPCGPERVGCSTARDKAVFGAPILTSKRKRRALGPRFGGVGSQRSQDSCPPAALERRENYIRGRTPPPKATLGAQLIFIASSHTAHSPAGFGEAFGGKNIAL